MYTLEVLIRTALSRTNCRRLGPSTSSGHAKAADRSAALSHASQEVRTMLIWGDGVAGIGYLV